MDGKIDAGFSNLLNFCRWMAALLVVISHVRGMIFADIQGFDPHAPLRALFYFLTGFGHGAVILFFVLSGYLVGGSAIGAWRAGRFSFPDYFIARFSRIYTVLLPALILVLVLDTAGQSLFGGAGFYTHPPRLHSLSFSIADRLDAKTFFGNLAMLQSILVEPFGSDVPLWSLANEWWYYLLFGALLWAAQGRPRPLQLCTALLVAAVTALCFPRQISLWFLIWLSGAALAAVEPRRRVPVWIGLPVFLLLLGLGRIPSLADRLLPDDFLRDFAVGLGFCLFLLSARQATRLPLSGLRLNAVLADFSYSVYLFHFPMLIFFGALAADRIGLPLPGLGGTIGGVCFIFATAALYLAALGLSRLTEARTARVRTALRRMLAAHQAV